MIRLGQKLAETRIKKGLSLDEISQSTKIKTSFLAAIEKGEYEKLPSVSYVSGFVRNYARFLDLPEDEILALFRREFNEEKVFKVLPTGLPKDQEFPLSGFKLKQTFILILVVFVAVFAYVVFQYRYAFLNPPLTISSPNEMETISRQTVEVIGKTDPNSTVYVDKNEVSVDSNGYFQKALSVFPGKTVITIKVVNKFGKQTTLVRNIIVKATP